MRSNTGLRAADKFIAHLRGDTSNDTLAESCGVTAFDAMGGMLTGRTNHLSMWTLFRMFQDNNLLIFPARVPLSVVGHLNPPFIAIHNHHFKTFTRPIQTSIVNGLPYAEDPELGVLPQEVFILTHEEPPAQWVLSKEQASLVKGSKSFGSRIAGAVKQVTKPVQQAVQNTVDYPGVKPGGVVGGVAGLMGGSPIAGAALGAGSWAGANALSEALGAGSMFGGGKSRSPEVDFGIPSPTGQPATQAGTAASGAIAGGLAMGVPGISAQMAQFVTPFAQPAFTEIDKQAMQQRKDLRERYAAAGFSRSGQLMEEEAKLDDSIMTQKRNTLSQLSAAAMGEANQLFSNLVNAGVQMEGQQLGHILGLTGLKAEEAGIRLGLDYAKINQARQDFKDIIGFGMQGAGLATAAMAPPPVTNFVFPTIAGASASRNTTSRSLRPTTV